MANISVGRKSGFILRRGVMRRETVWIGGQMGENAIATSGVAQLTSLNTAALALRPFTVVRTRGVFYVETDQVAAGEHQWGAYGFCVVSEQADAIGVTAIPTPITDQSSDLWYVYEIFQEGQKAFSVASAIQVVGHQFDSKAMRKVEDGEQIITAVEADANSDGFTFSSGHRTLLKLH